MTKKQKKEREMEIDETVWKEEAKMYEEKWEKKDEKEGNGSSFEKKGNKAKERGEKEKAWGFIPLVLLHITTFQRPKKHTK